MSVKERYHSIRLREYVVLGLLVLSSVVYPDCSLCEPCVPSQGCIPVQQCRVDCGKPLSNMSGQDDGCHAYSFFNPRQITPNNLYTNNLTLYWWYHDIICQEDTSWWSIQVMPFYQRSTDGASVASYFLPCQQSQIAINQAGTGDVGSLWLNLVAPVGQSVQACMAVRPQRTVGGAYVTLRFDASQLLCHSWLEIAFAAMHVKHDLHVSVCPSGSDGAICDVKTVCEAFNQQDWCFGKLSPCSMGQKGVDDVQIRYGYDWFYCDTDHISPYIVGTIGTGGRNDAEYLFEPVLGSKHSSVGLGLIADARVWLHELKELVLLMDFKYRYILHACQRRSFDLCKNGDWSRYMQVVQENAPSLSLPAINYLSRDVRVTPGSTIDVWLAAHYQSCQCNIEIGYDLWWRARERIELYDLPAGLALYDMSGDCELNPVSASCAMICQSLGGMNQPPSDDIFTPITCHDINIHSAAVPRALSSTIYCAFGYDSALSDFPVVIGIGGAYEIGHGNQALDTWSLWLRTGMAF